MPLAAFVALPGRDSAAVAEAPLAFDPSFYAASEPWILPGCSRNVSATLRNLSAADVQVDELRFSCPCATGAIDGANTFPIRIPARGAVPVSITITSTRGESGPVELRFGVIGRSGDRRVQARAAAAVRFVQAVNAEPGYLALGEVQREAEAQQHSVTLWSPAELSPPQDLQVESDDPCVTAGILAQVDAHGDDARRLNFARLMISIDPRKAPDRLHVKITLRSGEAVVTVPVLGFFIGEIPRRGASE
jgi:hypothetical protein